MQVGRIGQAGIPLSDTDMLNSFSQCKSFICFFVFESRMQTWNFSPVIFEATKLRLSATKILSSRRSESSCRNLLYSRAALLLRTTSRFHSSYSTVKCLSPKALLRTPATGCWWRPYLSLVSGIGIFKG